MIIIVKFILNIILEKFTGWLVIIFLRNSFILNLYNATFKIGS